jgi:hypothetical protein
MTIDDSLDLLVQERVYTVLSASIVALSSWLASHNITDKSSGLEALNKFDNIVKRVVQAGEYQPRRLPFLYKPPAQSQEREVSLSEKAFLSKMDDMTLDEGLQFMGQLMGAWILVCPEELIPELEIYPSRTRSEKFLALQKGFYRTIFEIMSRAA